MKYITYDETLGWDLRPYFSYLETVKSSMPAHLYDFASNPKHYYPASHVSLHDAWLEQFLIREIPDAVQEKKKITEITTSYLGPFHNLTIHLTYRCVVGYALTAPQHSFRQPPTQTAHGDLIVHEMRVIGQDLFEHELEFRKGAVFVIQFEDFQHRIDPIDARG